MLTRVLRRALTITESTNLLGPTTMAEGTGSTNLGTVTVEGNTVTMHLDQARYFNLNDRGILFESSLTAVARGARFSGSEIFAHYHNSAYLDLDIEDGFF